MTTDLTAQLRAQPLRIMDAENTLLQHEEQRRLVAAHLAQQEAELITCGTIDGKNQEMRTAQLLAHTGQEREALAACERSVKAAQILLRFEKDQLTVLLALARFIAS